MVRCCLSVKSCVNSQLQLLALGLLPTYQLAGFWLHLQVHFRFTVATFLRQVQEHSGILIPTVSGCSKISRVGSQFTF